MAHVLVHVPSTYAKFSALTLLLGASGTASATNPTPGARRASRYLPGSGVGTNSASADTQTAA